jgi:hypothetical protein
LLPSNRALQRDAAAETPGVTSTCGARGARSPLNATSLCGPEVRLARMHSNAYTLPVSYQWDPTKARANRAKHGVDFADAVGVFEDSRAITLDDPHP